MAPGLNLLRPRHRCLEGSHGGFFCDDGQKLERPPAAALMAYDGSSRSGVGVGVGGEEDEGEMMIKKDDGAEVTRGWLHLGIGAAVTARPALREDASTSRAKGGGGPVELDLFGAALRAPAAVEDGGGLVRSPFHLPLAGLQTLAPPWLHVGGARTLPPPPAASSHSSWGWLPVASLTSSSSAGLDSLVGEPMRVINLPRRTQTGVWFVLQAAQDQIKEPFLPQIPKSYLRIKDGRMTIRLLMKYLANKLVLEDESQVEISCRGRQLPPFMTLMYVRDNIWCSPEEAAACDGAGAAAPAARDHHHCAVNSSDSMSSSSRYVMSLLYCRSAA